MSSYSPPPAGHLPLTTPVADTATRHGAEAMCWSAVIAGALAAAALSLILLILGSGLGFAVASPWGDEGPSADAFGAAAVVWMILMAVAASALGGYLAGRLRHRWIEIKVEERYFRDTVHGFLTWAIATLIAAAALGSAASLIARGSAAIAGAAASAVDGPAVKGMALDRAEALSDDYFNDALFRSEGAAEKRSLDSEARAEVQRILAYSALTSETMADADHRYVVHVVAAQTGLSEAEAEVRVTQTVNQMRQASESLKETAREAADEAREAGAKLSLWIFVSLLSGAFAAAWAATLGGRHRNSWPVGSSV
ncbi:MAG: hypothetical protein K0Q76_3498 [Panacagrimonas sp.]|jgi:hypothetical protein|nr:hypothetical protein [Panacagrimonas sp.]MCC2658390.1 hypothetical protein [Panacagrimonas sp.]